MYAHHIRKPPRPPAAAQKSRARLRPLAGMLVAVACGLLASAGIVPAAFAMVAPPGQGGGTGGGSAGTPSTVQVITAGGMAGWQITLIALGAAVLAAAAAVILDRALRARRTASATTA
jgi:hypothetical protein